MSLGLCSECHRYLTVEEMMLANLFKIEKAICCDCAEALSHWRCSMCQKICNTQLNGIPMCDECMSKRITNTVCSRCGQYTGISIGEEPVCHKCLEKEKGDK